MSFAATWMDPETIVLSTASQRKTYMTLLTCGILKNYTNELTYKTEIDSVIENKHDYQRGGWKEKL